MADDARAPSSDLFPGLGPPRSWIGFLSRRVEELYEDLVELRRHLHAHPEPSGEERQTTETVQQWLVTRGIEGRRGPEGRGLVVDPPGPREAARIALRADLDALWIRDAKAAPYRSLVDGVMHACGHDVHTAVLCGALVALRDAEEEGVLPWPIAWRGIFQPAEETTRGALEMIECGALSGVEAILALHVDPSRPVGTIGVREGVLTAAGDEMEVTIEGRGGHAARPHESIDPIAAAAQLISSLYLFVPRAVDSQEPVVVTIGQIAGGHSPNVIPDDVVLRGTLRTLGPQTRERTQKHIGQLARGIAETSGAAIRVDFRRGPPSVVNDPAITAVVRRAGDALLGAEHVQTVPRPSMGGEDFAYYLDRVPGVLFRLGTSSSNATSASLHSPLFDVDERALRVGASMLASTLVLLSDPERRESESPPWRR